MSISNYEQFELGDRGFRVGEWQVEPSRNLLIRHDDHVRVEPRVMDALVYLSGRRGKVVSKDELASFVWQGRCVTDDVMTVTISALRKALRDDARNPKYIETIPRRGYRWIAHVSRPCSSSETTALTAKEIENAARPASHRSYVSLFVVPAILITSLVAGSVWIVFRAIGPRHVSLPEAHEAYLKGRYFLDQRSIRGWRQALEQFQRAAALDPQDPAAQAGLADTYSAMSDFGVASSPEMRPRAFQSAKRALELDRKSAEAYEALGRAQFLFDWDFATAERSLNRALSLNPDYMPTHQAMAWLKSAEGKYVEAVTSAQVALQLDPVNIARYTELAWVLSLSGRYQEAQYEIERAIALNPRSFEAYLMKGWISDLAGDTRAAFQAYYDGLRIAGVPDEGLRRIASLYRKDGLPGYYRNWLDVQRTGGKMPMSSTFRAQLYVHAGEVARALDSLEDAYQKREGALAWVNVEPSFQPLRSEPRFKVIAEHIGGGFPAAR